MPNPRVAVIVVHGVADQQPGETARAVVELLVSSAPPDTSYTSESSADLTLRVAPLQPQEHVQPEAARDVPPTPDAKDRSLPKSLAQSLRSDFQTQQWAAGKPAYRLRPAGDIAAEEIAAPPTLQDRGIAVTNYLLAKHANNGATPESYDTRCIALRRHDVAPEALRRDDDRATHDVDVYEMYWADLSRLSGSVPRIVSELFTLVFRLSKLGRETVDEMRGQLARARDPKARSSRRYALAWSTLAWLQIGLDWLFVNGLALLFAQLGLIGVLLGLLGLLPGAVPQGTVDQAILDAARRHEQWLQYGTSIALATVSALRVFYCLLGRRFAQLLLPLGLLAGAAVALACGTGALQWVTVALLLAGVTLAYEVALRVADERFPLVHFVGRLMWITLLLFMAASAINEIHAVPGGRWRDVCVHAALYATEAVLLVIKASWIVAGLLLLAWIVAGQFARGESGYASRASVATGRLGVTVSLGMFLTVTMTVWALVNDSLGLTVANESYQPCLFLYAPDTATPASAKAACEAGEGAPPCVVAYRPGAGSNATLAVAPLASDACDVKDGGRAAACTLAWRPAASVPPQRFATNACFGGYAGQAHVSATPPTAGAVLSDRYRKSTSSFAPLATLQLLLVAYLLTMFTPSVLAELKLIVDARRDAHQRKVDERDARESRQATAQSAQRARALGRWLTKGYLNLDLAVGLVAAAGVGLGLVIAVAFLATIVAAGQTAGWFEDARRQVSDASQWLFAPLQAAVFSAAGLGAALSVLGGQLSRRLPSLRSPLDVAMDVDNHFREFPRTDIPRAHIFSRYVALLEHVRTQDYERIVIVSHSQGTIISAELLRFLSSRDQQAPTDTDAPLLGGKPLPPVSLLTLGCPLRQLYAARFPGLYAWVLARNGQVFGPRAADLGVRRWMNAFCSGDYIGRWLWSHAGRQTALAHPMSDTLHHDPFGRADVYAGFKPSFPTDAQLRPAREAEVCLGLGAHTHYFERNQTLVARMIDWLVRAAPPGDPAGGAAPVPTIDAPPGGAARVVPVESSVVSDGTAAPALAPDTAAPEPPSAT